MMGSRGTQTDRRSGDLLVLKHLTMGLIYNSVGCLLRFKLSPTPSGDNHRFFNLKPSETIQKSPAKYPE